MFEGIFFAILLVLISFSFMGPYGIVVVVIVMFGMSYRTYKNNAAIAADLKHIKEKLGLLTEDELMELDLKKGILAEKDPIAMSKINAEIERELERNEEDDKR
ncbi:YaeH family protein [Paenibacillus sp. CAU 1782]